MVVTVAVVEWRMRMEKMLVLVQVQGCINMTETFVELVLVLVLEA